MRFAEDLQTGAAAFAESLQQLPGPAKLFFLETITISLVQTTDSAVQELLPSCHQSYARMPCLRISTPSTDANMPERRL